MYFNLGRFGPDRRLDAGTIGIAVSDLYDEPEPGASLHVTIL